MLERLTLEVLQREIRRRLAPERASHSLHEVHVALGAGVYDLTNSDDVQVREIRRALRRWEKKLDELREDG